MSKIIRIEKNKFIRLLRLNLPMNKFKLLSFCEIMIAKKQEKHLIQLIA